MRNVVLTRVDERLIHGQVMTSWLKLCNANVILIIDAGFRLKRVPEADPVCGCIQGCGAAGHE